MDSFQIYKDTGVFYYDPTISLEFISADGTLDGNVDISILDTSDTELNVFLTEGVEGARKIVKLLQPTNNAEVSVEGGGTFILTPSIPQRELFFVNGVWKNYTKDTYMYYAIDYKTTLIGNDAVGNSWQGNSVSLSADGKTLAIGGSSDSTNIGATWIFVNINGVWVQQGGKLIGTGYVGNSLQGHSVSLSADGNTLAVGGYADNDSSGATWIFTRSNGVWTQQGDKLTDAISANNKYQGYSVCLSADGNTLAVGGYGDTGNVGATWVYTRNNNIWDAEQKIVATNNVGLSYQGFSVSLSANGDTLAIGGTNDNIATGATWIWIRNNGVWSEQQKLIGTGGVKSTQFGQGHSVSLSADGNTLAIGAPNYDSYAGGTWIFTRANGSWTQQGDKLVGLGGIVRSPNRGQGGSLCLSADGNTLAVGAYGDDTNNGAVWVFTRTNGVWAQRGDKLKGTGGGDSFVYFGTSVNMSADCNILAVGETDTLNSSGSTWIYT